MDAMTISFYPDDIVRLRHEQSLLAEVLLVHEEAENSTRVLPWQQGSSSLQRHPSVSQADYKAFMLSGVPPRGVVVVEWFERPMCEIVRQSELQLLDRSLFSGDIVKRHTRDAMSGVVLNTKSFCSLLPAAALELACGNTLYGITSSRHRITKELKLQQQPGLIEDVPFTELESTQAFDVGDLVIYGDWIGHVSSLTQAYTLLLHDGTVVEICGLDEPDALDADAVLGDIIQTQKGILRRGRWIFGRYNPSIDPVGTIVAVRIIEVEVAWLHSRAGSSAHHPPRETLDRTDIESDRFRVYDRSRHPDQGHSDQTVTFTEPELTVFERVRFKDLPTACNKYRGRFSRVPRSATSGYDLTVFDIIRTRRRVSVMWQDLSITEHDSTELIPDLAMEDEHSAWPGEIALSLDLNPVANLPGCYTPGKVGIIQSVEASSRLAQVRWCPDARIQYAVEEEKPGLPKIEAPKTVVQFIVGSCDGTAAEVSLYDIETPGTLNVRRGDVVLINEPATSRLSTAVGLNWLGEIVQDRLDGTLLIRLGAASQVQDVVFRREEVTLAIRSDDEVLDEEDDLLSLDESMDIDKFTDEEDDNNDNDGDDDRNDDRGSVISLNMHEITYEDETGKRLAESEVEDEDWESTSEQADEDSARASVRHFEDGHTDRHGDELPDLTSTSEQVSHEDVAGRTDVCSTSDRPAQYRLLACDAPTDHHFNTEQEPSAFNMKKIHKEHRILQRDGALPQGVYVTTWQSRLDLLRILLIGPHDTPYADAPFVIDLWLSPAFPHEPPQAHFHSWAGQPSLGGIGRVNPNLYEDGTICLSLLGTWSGEKRENWIADNSTLLQVIVSILGLVLVREPYFNEAGYEHLVGTDAAKRPSILYNERASVRALSLTISAVSAVQQNSGLAGLSGLEEVVRWLYLRPQGPLLLRQVHEHVRAILKRSEEAPAESDGINVLSQGALIQLRRVSTQLESMLDTMKT